MNLPVIAIIGRPNVGKSSLLNALVNRRISIVQDQPGVTRDRVTIPLEIDGHYVEMMDTGGYGFDDPDQLTEQIQHQIELALESAALVLFVVDAETGLTGGDDELAALLRKSGRKVVLLANKADGPTKDTTLADFARFGWGTPIGVSAMNGRNLDQIIQVIRKNVDLSAAPTQLPPPQMMVAIVGKRNSGKSTLVNAIAGLYEGEPERVIVSEVPGTTRDSIDVRFEKDGQALIVIDTAGVRKKRHMVTNDVEFYSFHRAQRSIRRADVVLLLIDSTEPVSEVDKKLAQYVAEQFKPVILVVNKWDLARQQAREQRKEYKEHGVDDSALMAEYGKYLSETLQHVDYAPIAFITATETRNVQGVLDLCQAVNKETKTRLTTGQLNRVVREILLERVPSTPNGRRARVYYATQTAVAPPTIVLFVNNPAFLTDSYRRFVINRFRTMLPYSQVPIKLIVRGRQQKTVTPSLEDVEEVPKE
jgi:GTP-binding protein